MSQPPPLPAWEPPPPPAPRPKRTARYILITAAAAVAAFFGAGAIGTALNDDQPNPGACKAAMQQQYERGMQGDTTPGQRPPECHGVDDATLQRYVGEILEEQLGKQVEDTLNGLATASP